MPARIIIGNWKINGTVKSLAAMMESLKSVDLAGVTVVLCPPMPLIGAASIAPVAFGAQDVSAHDTGPYTGEVSAGMIAETGAKYVIVGHSDRRRNHCEKGESIAKKAEMAFRAGLIPIICVGESATERKSGKTLEAIEKQLKESVPAAAQNFIIAYEPIWAAGIGHTTPSGLDIENAHTHIYNVLRRMGKSAPVIYGGSADAGNSGEIMSIRNVDGVMVGRASLSPADFLPIIKTGKQNVEQ